MLVIFVSLLLLTGHIYSFPHRGPDVLIKTKKSNCPTIDFNEEVSFFLLKCSIQVDVVLLQTSMFVLWKAAMC